MKKPEDVVAEMWKAFGRWMVERREELGWTQIFAAKKADMERQQWQRLEKGASTKRTTVIRIADALMAPREEALKRAGFMAPVEGQELSLPEDEDVAVILYEYDQLNKQDKKEIKLILQMAREEIRKRLRQKKK